jgi:hypothetical protein
MAMMMNEGKKPGMRKKIEELMMRGPSSSKEMEPELEIEMGEGEEEMPEEEMGMEEEMEKPAASDALVNVADEELIAEFKKRGLGAKDLA